MSFFVGKDVAEALGYDQADKAVLRHVDEDDRTKHTVIYRKGRTQSAYVINESGLYSLVLSSKLPQAKEFKHWVTSEVLPQISKTGRYELLPKEVKRLAALSQKEGASASLHSSREKTRSRVTCWKAEK